MTIRDKIKRIDWRLPVFLAYLTMLVVLTVFHEPWYDEAQAWMIAKNATWKELFFSIPHYEGHPPLWHLILRPFALLGLPYEPCIKGVSMVIAGVSVWLLLYRSPFPKPLKLALPFTYFLLYQYAVISRPYCLLLLAFFLAACAWPRKNERPWPFVGALLLLCAASSYGIVLAGGIAIAWLLELHQKKEAFTAYVRRIAHGRVFVPLLVLLVFALLLIALIFPAADANGVNMDDTSRGFLFRFVYMLFVAPIDALFYDSMDYGALVWQDISMTVFVPGLLIGAVIMGMLVWFAARCKKTPLFVIPHVLYALFCAKVYFWIHHLGIWFLFLLFFLWCCLSDGKKLDELLPRSEKTVIPFYLVTIFSVSVSILWSCAAGYADITHTYGHGRALHAFLEENGLTNYSMLVAWEHDEDADTGETLTVDPVNCTLSIALLPYYPHNLFFNFREGTDQQCYSLNTLPDDARSQEVIDYCREYGMPEVIVGSCYLTDLYTQAQCDSVSYIAVASFDDNYIWKNTIYDNYYYVYVRTDVAEELGLTATALREQDE